MVTISMPPMKRKRKRAKRRGDGDSDSDYQNLTTSDALLCMSLISPESRLGS